MIKNPLHHISPKKIILFLLTLVFCFGVIRYQKNYTIYAIGLALFVWLFSHIIRSYTIEKWAIISNRALASLKDEISSYVDTINIPMVLTDKRQVIRWNNPAFVGLVKKDASTHRLENVIKDFNKPSKDKSIIYGGTKFIKEVFEYKEKKKRIIYIA